MVGIIQKFLIFLLVSFSVFGQSDWSVVDRDYIMFHQVPTPGEPGAPPIPDRTQDIGNRLFYFQDTGAFYMDELGVARRFCTDGDLACGGNINLPENVTGPSGGTHQNNRAVLWDGVDTWQIKDAGYTLPSSPGTIGQILQLTTAVDTAWVDVPISLPPDLGVEDLVLLSDGNNNGKWLDTGSADQFLKQNFDGTVEWADIPGQTNVSADFYRANSFLQFGFTNRTAVMFGDTVRSEFTTCGTITNDINLGTVISITSNNCMVMGTFTWVQGGGTETFGATLNPTTAELSQPYSQLPRNKKLCIQTTLGVDENVQTCTFMYKPQVGDAIYFQGPLGHPLGTNSNFGLSVTAFPTGMGVAQAGGNVVGPPSSVTDNIATWDNTTGTRLKDSGVAVGQIQTNTTDIATNTGDIAANTAAIGILQTTSNDHGVRIADNEAQIATNRINISAVTAKADQNESDISDLQTEVAGHIQLPDPNGLPDDYLLTIENNAAVWKDIQTGAGLPDLPVYPFPTKPSYYILQSDDIGENVDWIMNDQLTHIWAWDGNVPSKALNGEVLKMDNQSMTYGRYDPNTGGYSKRYMTVTGFPGTIFWGAQNPGNISIRGTENNSTGFITFYGPNSTFNTQGYSIYLPNVEPEVGQILKITGTLGSPSDHLYQSEWAVDEVGAPSEEGVITPDVTTNNSIVRWTSVDGSAIGEAFGIGYAGTGRMSFDQGITVGSSGDAGTVTLAAENNNVATITPASTINTSYTLTLPDRGPETNDRYLVSNNAGALSWQDIPTDNPDMVRNTGGSTTANVAFFQDTTGKLIYDAGVPWQNLNYSNTSSSPANRPLLASGTNAQTKFAPYEMPETVGTLGQQLISNGTNIIWADEQEHNGGANFSFNYVKDGAFAATCPPEGRVRLNSPIPTNVTQIWINATDDHGGNITNTINEFDDGDWIGLASSIGGERRQLYKIVIGPRFFASCIYFTVAHHSNNGANLPLAPVVVDFSFAKGGDVDTSEFVKGPSISISGDLAMFNGVTGKLITNSGIRQNRVLTASNPPGDVHRVPYISVAGTNVMEYTGWKIPNTTGAVGQVLTMGAGNQAAWQDAAGGGGISGPNISTNTSIPTWDGSGGDTLENRSSLRYRGGGVFDSENTLVIGEGTDSANTSRLEFKMRSYNSQPHPYMFLHADTASTSWPGDGLVWSQTINAHHTGGITVGNSGGTNSTLEVWTRTGGPLQFTRYLSSSNFTSRQRLSFPNSFTYWDLTLPEQPPTTTNNTLRTDASGQMSWQPAGATKYYESGIFYLTSSNPPWWPQHDFSKDRVIITVGNFTGTTYSVSTPGAGSNGTELTFYRHWEDSPINGNVRVNYINSTNGYITKNGSFIDLGPADSVTFIYNAARQRWLEINRNQ